MAFWLELLREKKKTVLLSLIGVAALAVILGIYIWQQPPAEDFIGVSLTEGSSIETESSENTSEAAEILVDVKGEIRKPGVYPLSVGARMFELIDLAGGFTDDANQKVINLAAELTDQQMVYIPHVEEAASIDDPLVQETPAEGEAASGKININTADITQLQELSGIGAKKAQAIIDYREENGLFKTVDDLTNVSGIGEKTVEKLRDSIRI